MTKKYTFLLFLIVPVFFLFIGLQFDRTKYGTDPESAYLINGLNIATGKAVGHFDNPGTTVQLYSAIVLRITHLFRMSGTDIQTDVLTHSELYIEILRYSLIVFNTFILFFLGLVASRYVKNIWVGIVLQLAPFLSVTLIEHLYTKVAPEPILFSATSLLALLILKYYNSANRSNIKFPVVFGTIAGFGLATKMTFLPVLIIPFILLESKKTKLIYSICTIAAFFLFTLPAAKGYAKMAEWFINLGTHTGTYGQGEAGILNPNEYANALIAIGKNNIAMITILLISCFILIFSFLHAKKSGNKSFRIEHKIILALVLCLIGAIVIVAKHYHANHYFFPSLSLLGLLIASLYLLINKRLNKNKTWLSKLSLPVVAVLLIGFSLLNIPKLTLAYKGYRMSNQSTDEAMARLEKEYPSYTKVYYYPSSFNEFSSIRWGNVYARKFHTDRLVQLFPNGLFYNPEEKSFQLWENNITPRDFVQKYGYKILLVGGPRTYEGIKLVEESGIKIKRLFDGRVQVVFEIDTSNSRIFKNLRGRNVVTLSVKNDFELLSKDKKWFVSDKDELFCKTNSLKTGIARSGNQSLELPKIDTYAMEYYQNNVKPGDEYEISIWLKGPSDNVFLCATGEQSGNFYKQSKGFIEADKKGWQKVVLAFTIPDNFTGSSLKMYLWNHSNNKVYFDDFQLIKY